MEKLLDELKAWGCDVEGAIERFLGDTELYVRCLEKLTREEELKKLGEELKAGRTESAFDCAHMLKGVTANMGLLPMYESTACLVESLRAGRAENLEPAYEKLLRENEYLKKLLRGE